MRKLGDRYQRTLSRPAEVCGVGFLTGAMVRLAFHPAPPDSGIVFIRTDVRPEARIPARFDRVVGTQRRTTLGEGPLQVALVEHALAALAGLRIDNCKVLVNAGEAPGLDGSAGQFVEALQSAGAVLQPARQSIWGVADPVVVAAGGATITLYPAEADQLVISYYLDFGTDSPIHRQLHTQAITPESFANNLACCRTFLLESEAIELRKQGLGPRTTVSDLLVIGPRGPIDNSYRCADELARHKVLDIVGDLALFGHDLRGHLVAYRSGHPLNAELVRTLAARMGRSAPRRQAA